MPRKLSEAPGLEWKTQGKIRVPRWRARKNAVKLGYRPSVIRLDIDPDEHIAIAQRCREEWAKMEAWLRAEHRPVAIFDGTLGSLIDIYASDPESPYRELKYSTQQAYDDDLKILKNTVGARRLDKLIGEDFLRWYRKLREPKIKGGPQRIRRAHGVMTMLRIVLGYGIVVGIPNCKRLKEILSEMRFKTAPPRKEVLTYDQAVAFIAKAHELGQPELALGQALQFEGTLRQIDIIGEWLPDPERPSGLRWANGLLWQDIKEYVLQKGTTKTGAEAAIDFNEYPLALAELRRVPSGERVGPVMLGGASG
jgi:hypothetical protein